MIERRKNSINMSRWLQYLILVDGLLILVVSVAMLVAVIDLGDEVRLNRETGCISRYLDGSRYAPACQEFIDDYKETH